ncbi:MAG: MBL fold metallo-hydrolase [Alkalispirochaeta sp.]
MLIDRIIVGSMYTNSYIVSTGKKECVIIDPGADADVLIKRLEAMNLLPKAIVFTHGHLDHTSATGAVRAFYTERNHHIPVGIHEADSGYLGSTAENTNHEVFSPFGEVAMEAFRSFSTDVPAADFYYGEGDTLPDSDLHVMHTPGHSSGSVCFYSEPRQAVFSGDTLFFNTVGRTDVVHADSESLQDSISHRLFELPPETRVFPGHGPLTTIEREIRNNPMVSDGATI